MKNFQPFYQKLNIGPKAVIIVKKLNLKENKIVYDMKIKHSTYSIDHGEDNLYYVFISVDREIFLHMFVEVSVNKNGKFDKKTFTVFNFSPITVRRVKATWEVVSCFQIIFLVCFDFIW